MNYAMKEVSVNIQITLEIYALTYLLSSIGVISLLVSVFPSNETTNFSNNLQFTIAWHMSTTSQINGMCPMV
jgi:hypothetical protein